VRCSSVSTKLALVYPVPRDDRGRGIVHGLLAAAFFGLSAPLAKQVLTVTGPVLLAGLLYLAGGLSLTAVAGVKAARGRRSAEARLVRADAPYLLGIIVLGGIAGPILILLGLQRVSGFVGSLLLNLEAPLTMLIAVVFFREHLARWEAVAAIVSLMRTAATTPDANVSAATSHIATETPNASAVMPASSAPIAYPRSRQSRMLRKEYTEDSLVVRVGMRIRKLRMEQGISHRGFGKLAGVHPFHVMAIELGQLATTTILAMKRSGRQSEAAEAARRYLARFPKGFRRAEAESIAAGSPAPP